MQRDRLFFPILFYFQNYEGHLLAMEEKKIYKYLRYIEKIMIHSIFEQKHKMLYEKQKKSFQLIFDLFNEFIVTKIFSNKGNSFWAKFCWGREYSV